MPLKAKRVYETPDKTDGQRILVDRLWPRGLSKDKAAVDLWLKEIAPSTNLRKWFNHNPDKWPEFKKRYLAELKANPTVVKELKSVLKSGAAVLVYGAKDEKYNQATALCELLEKL